MDLEQVFQSHRFERRDLPPHRVYVALRLDGRLVKITSRHVFRETRATQSWLEEVVRDLGGSYESVKVEQFRIIPDLRAPDENPEEGTGVIRAVFALDEGTRVKGLVEGFDPVHMRRVSVREVDAQDKLIQIHDIEVLSILAAFFVKDLHRESSPKPSERGAKRVVPVRPLRGRRVTLAMVWGERMRGELRAYDPHGLWYEFFTIDPKRVPNQKRALISRRAIARAQPDVIASSTRGTSQR